MAVDWAQAWQIGGIGFGLVFAVLVILAFTMWLTGLLLKKLGTDSSDSGGKNKEDQKLALKKAKTLSVNVSQGSVVEEGS